MRHHILNTLQAVILIAILSFILSTLSACNGKAGGPGYDPNAAVPVATQEVKLSTASYDDIYPGTIVALNQIELRAQVSGFVTGVYFKDGDHVSKGQKLYSIDPQLYAANYDQAKANLSVQETNLVKAQKDADRYHELAKNDAIAKQQSRLCRCSTRRGTQASRCSQSSSEWRTDQCKVCYDHSAI